VVGKTGATVDNPLHPALAPFHPAPFHPAPYPPHPAPAPFHPAPAPFHPPHPPARAYDLLKALTVALVPAYPPHTPDLANKALVGKLLILYLIFLI